MALSALEEFCAWTPADFEGRDCYLGNLNEAPRLAEWREAVHYGRGFVLLRRVAIESLSEAGAVQSFAALAGQFGGVIEPPRRLSGTEIACALSSLTPDLTAFACLRAPAEGLAIELASAVGLHNALLAEAHATLAWLYQADDTSPPAFRRRGAKLSVRLDGAGTDESPRGRALGLARARAGADALTLALEPGDLLIINNHHTLVGSPARAGGLLRFALRAPLMAVPGFAAGEPQASTPQAEDASQAA
jgi:hypothetical protein